MKLLFDENLSPSLALLVADLFPESSHVHLPGLDKAPDLRIWDLALEREWVIVTRAATF